MSAAIASDVIPIEGADRGPPPNNTTRADEIMASIQGEDHQLLAAILNLRMDGVEKKVDDFGGKVDTLSGTVNQLVGKISVLVPDDDSEALAAKKPTLVGLLYKHPWLLPVTIVVAGLVFGSTAFFELVNR